MFCRVSCTTALMVLSFGLLPVTGSALIVEQSLPELVAGSDVIVRGAAMKTECRWGSPQGDPDSRIIYTDVTLSVLESYKGLLDDAELVIETPGGEVGDVGLRVEDAPRFQAGEEVVVFLGAENELGRRVVTNSCNGKYTLADDRVVEKDESVGWFVSRIINAVREEGRER